MFKDLSLCQIVTGIGIIVSIVLAALILDKVNKKGQNSGLRKAKDYLLYGCAGQPQVNTGDFTAKDCAKECNRHGENECCNTVCDRDENGVYSNCKPVTNRHCNFPLLQ